MFRPVSAGALALDIVVAATCVALRLLLGADSALLTAAIVLFGAALALHRISPPVALAVSWAGAILQMAAGAPPDAANLAILPVLYSAARHGGPALRWSGLASAVLGAAVASAYLTIRDGGLPPQLLQPSLVAFQFTVQFVALLALLGLSWTTGFLARSIAQARQSRRTQAEAERIAVVEQERNRIARDVHDVVAHSLAVVIAQADGARYARAGDPGAVDDALSTIASTAREALADVRLLLGELRREAVDSPQPVLADLAALVDQVRAAGLDVRTEIAAISVPLTTSQQLAIYRVLQEALTNALRHGDPDRPVRLELNERDGSIDAVVANAVRAGSVDRDAVGHGLTGMVERAHLVGGSLEAAPLGDEFVVRLRVPVRDEVRS